MKRPGRKTVIILFIAAVIAVSAIVGVTVVLDKLSHLEAYKTDIIKTVKTTLNRDVLYDKALFTFHFGPTFTFHNIQIREKDSPSTFAKADKLTFKIALLPLLWKKVIIREVGLDNPRIALSRDPKGVFNISDLLEDKKEGIPLEIRRMVVRGGAITFSDQGIIPSGIVTTVKDVELRMDHFARGKDSGLRLSAVIPEGEKTATLSVNGDIRLAAREEPLSKSTIDARIRTTGLSAERYRPYYEKYIPFRQISGVFELDTHIEGNPYRFSASGSVTVRNAVLDYPDVFRAPLTPKMVRMAYTLKRSPSEVTIDPAEVGIDGATVKGSFSIRDIDTDDPLIVAGATTTPLSLEQYGRYIPYGIIPRGVAGFIETRIKAGTYQLHEGSLNGRISRIAHMEKADNYNVLHIRAGVESGVLAFGGGVPAFTGIKGELELKGKDFHLRHMTGHFGASPMALEGRITDYPLTTPAGYPFSMTMKPGRDEIAWLLGLDKKASFKFSGDTTLRLTGTGTTDSYELEGDWDLAGAGYNYQDLLAKPPGTANRLKGKARFSREELHLASFSYQLAPLALEASGVYRFQDKQILSAAIRSNAFPLEGLAPYLPGIGKYQPSGTIRLSVTADSPSKTAKGPRWGGSIDFSDIAFRPAGAVKPVRDFTGAVRIKGNGMETSWLTGRFGNSIIRARATVPDLKNPALSLSASSEQLDLEDIGLKNPSGPVRLKKIAAGVLFKDKGMQIQSLSARLNDSVFNITGTMPDLNQPAWDLRISSSRLDSDDLILLGGLEGGKKGKSSSGLSLKASVQSDVGKIGRMVYTKLSTSLTYRDRAWEVHTLDLDALGGRFSGKGRITTPRGGATHYMADFDIRKMSAEQILKFAGAEGGHITGSLTMQGDLTAQGSAAADLKRTARGKAKVLMENGTLKQFAVLSKVFSILNVSQLLKFQLPDMVSGGMPYTAITATMTIKDGILESNDLFIKSDAMNMSIIGKTDIIREELNQTIGVQPLQTLDKIVSHIPVVGWILTNETKSLVSFYFEAKGKWGAPTVQAMPVTTMAGGVFNIFKRLFQLPEKLITDTGEVLFGR